MQRPDGHCCNHLLLCLWHISGSRTEQPAVGSYQRYLRQDRGDWSSGVGRRRRLRTYGLHAVQRAHARDFSSRQEVAQARWYEYADILAVSIPLIFVMTRVQFCEWDDHNNSFMALLLSGITQVSLYQNSQIYHLHCPQSPHKHSQPFLWGLPLYR